MAIVGYQAYSVPGISIIGHTTVTKDFDVDEEMERMERSSN